MYLLYYNLFPFKCQGLIPLLTGYLIMYNEIRVFLVINSSWVKLCIALNTLSLFFNCKTPLHFAGVVSIEQDIED